MLLWSESFILISLLSLISANNSSVGLKILTPEEVRNFLETPLDGPGFNSVLAKDGSRYIPQDHGGNYGDLIYRYREKGDILLIRELVVIDELSPSELELQWYASLNTRRISSVRVMNIGRERAYCARITVAATSTQTLLRLPPWCDPRIMVEVYGF